MATNWPNSVQTFTNPSPGDSLSSPSHADQHTTVNDTVEALQQYAGLVLVKTQTIGSGVTSVTVTDAFSSTFDAYRIIVAGGSHGSGALLQIQLGSSTAGYYSARALSSYASGSYLGGNLSNGSFWNGVGVGYPAGLMLNADIVNPGVARNSYFSSAYAGMTTSEYAGSSGGWHDSAIAYTSFILFPNVGTLTGGTIRVYGYNNG